LRKDYYKILGVARTASQKQIEDAYDALLIAKHPDRLGNTPEANREFAQINEAYEVLRKPDKRKAYDEELKGGAPRPAPAQGGRGAAAGKAPAGKGGQAVPTDNLFGGVFASMFGGVPGAKPPTGAAKTPTAAPTAPGSSEIPIEITLEEAFYGGQRMHRAEMTVPCPDCGGTGRARGGRAEMMMQPCGTCHGRKKVRRMEEVPVRIPPGAYEGAKLIVKGRGPGGGDIKLTARLQKHSRFTVENQKDLRTEVAVPYTVMVLGGTVEVETLAGPKGLPIPPGTPNGKRLQMTGLGLPALKNTPTGDLYVVVRVDIPSKVSAEERDLLIRLARLRGESVQG
jgi:DnaJ-class molecular chaperone